MTTQGGDNKGYRADSNHYLFSTDVLFITLCLFIIQFWYILQFIWIPASFQFKLLKTSFKTAMNSLRVIESPFSALEFYRRWQMMYLTFGALYLEDDGLYAMSLCKYKICIKICEKSLKHTSKHINKLRHNV